MTLILSCLTPKYIVQVSDRRLTWPDGGLADDSANKAVLFGPNAVFSYTGISEIGKLRTDEWIAERLAGRSGIQDAINHLTKSLDNEVRKLRHPNRQLAVIVDCWATTEEGKPDRPWSCAITNFYDKETRQQVDRPFDTFHTFSQTLPPDKGYAFLPLGQNIPPEVIKDLFRNVVRAMRHAAPTPTTVLPITVGRFMRDTVLEVAKGNERVGSNLMLAILFNRQIPEYASAINMFGYYGKDSSDPTYYAPAIVTPRITIKGLKVHKGSPHFRRGRSR